MMIDLKPEDLRIDCYSSAPRTGWCVGMPVGVRITHIPTGISVTREDNRSQHRNKAAAMDDLRIELEKLGQRRISTGRWSKEAEMMESWATPATGTELYLGVSVIDGVATIVISQPLEGGKVGIVYSGTHPTGDSSGRFRTFDAPAAPLATPADAGAGLIVKTWVERMGPDYKDGGADLPEEVAMKAEIAELREVLTRMSKPTAQGTASVRELLANAETALDMAHSYVNDGGGPVDDIEDASVAIAQFLQGVPASGSDERELFEAWEPVAYMVRRDEDGHVFGIYTAEKDAIVTKRWYDSAKIVPLYATPAPAERDAIRDQALEEAARLVLSRCIGFKADDSDLHEMAAAIRALKSMERAADAAETRDAKGGE